MSQAELDIDDLEQYSRSNCLILHGSKFLGTNSPHSSNQEPKQLLESVSKDCEKHVIDTSNSKLNLPTPITSSDIDICHPLRSATNKNPIIIKFVRRTVRNMVFYH